MDKCVNHAPHLVPRQFPQLFNLGDDLIGTGARLDEIKQKKNKGDKGLKFKTHYWKQVALWEELTRPYNERHQQPPVHSPVHSPVLSSATSDHQQDDQQDSPMIPEWDDQKDPVFAADMYLPSNQQPVVTEHQDDQGVPSSSQQQQQDDQPAAAVNVQRPRRRRNEVTRVPTPAQRTRRPPARYTPVSEALQRGRHRFVHHQRDIDYLCELTWGVKRPRGLRPRQEAMARANGDGQA